MTAEAWVGLAAIIVTVLSAGAGWATYIAWKASQMDTNITGMRTDIVGLRNDIKANDDDNSADHQKIWESVGELKSISQLHETRLVRIEAKGTP